MRFDVSTGVEIEIKLHRVITQRAATTVIK
jgi:hypothetical protein